MRAALVVVLAAALAVANADPASSLRGTGLLGSSPASNCGSSNDVAQNLKVTISPENPQQGDPYTLTLDFDLTEEITKGTMVIKADFSGYPVVDETDDLCTKLSENNINCPIAPGHYTWSWKDTEPTGLPHGTLSGSEVWKMSDGREILCFAYKYGL